MQVTDRRCFIYDARIVVVHTVDICPDLDFINIEGCTDQRSAIVATATLQVINFTVSITANVTLSDIQLGILMFIQQFNQTFFDIYRVRFCILVRPHIFQCRKQDRLHTCFIQIQVHHAGRDQFALCQHDLFFEQGEQVFSKSADIIEMRFYKFFGFLLIFVGTVQFFDMSVIFLCKLIDDFICTIRIFLVQVVGYFNQRVGCT